jgi:hypothetical protein
MSCQVIGTVRLYHLFMMTLTDCYPQITRLAPQQAHLTISTVNNRPVPESSEEFVGVVRIADIR